MFNSHGSGLGGQTDFVKGGTSFEGNFCGIYTTDNKYNF